MATSTRQYTAKLRYARITARKARLVADLIRGQSVNRALELLEFAPQRAAAFYAGLVKSAMANASQEEGVNVNRLVVTDCRADGGPLLNNRMRFRPGPQGRAMPIHKRTAHLTVGVSEPVATGGGKGPKKPAAEKSAPKKTAPKKTAEKKATETGKETAAE